jgi:hypothetical protein
MIVMSPQVRMQLICGLLGIVIVTACTGSPAAPHHPATPHAASPPVASRAAPPSPRPLTLAEARWCPRTMISHPIGPMGGSPGGNSPGTSAYGNGKLVVWALDVRGTIVATPDFVNPDGSIGWKFPWMRMVPGSLIVTGRRLDAPAPPLKSWVPSGYGDIGFQASGVTFPSEGCWRITGKVDHTSVTFVNLVITAAHRGLLRGLSRYRPPTLSRPFESLRVLWPPNRGQSTRNLPGRRGCGECGNVPWAALEES